VTVFEERVSLHCWYPPQDKKYFY